MADRAPRKEGFLATFTSPRRWPVRWRIAGVSAALTFLILVVFALVVGRLVTERLRNDFDDEVRDAAIQLSSNVLPPSAQHMTVAGTAEVRIVTANGTVLFVAPPGAPSLGPPRVGLTTLGSLRVVTTPIPDNAAPPEYLQYARSVDTLNATVNRLWLFLGTGVLGGALLATFAGLAIAGRAMRPVSALTGAARKIAATRDPSRRVPQPEADD